MGNYLKLEHGRTPIHIWARHPSKNYGHEWIDVDGITLDITLDQFDDRFPRAYAGQMLPFHRALSVNDKTDPATIEMFVNVHHGGSLPIAHVYAQITSYVDQALVV